MTNDILKSTLVAFSYNALVRRGNDWYGYTGYVFARDVVTAMRLIEERYTNGVLMNPFGNDILPGDEVRIRTIKNVHIEEGVFL